MAAVFPESMDRLDNNDPKTSLSIIEQYIGYMTERVEFSMRNMTKTVSEAGISSAEMYIIIQAQAQILANLQSAMAAANGAITALSGDMRQAQADIADTNTRVDGVNARLGDLETAFSDQGLTVVDGKLCQTYIE